MERSKEEFYPRYLFTRYVRNLFTSVAECGTGCCVSDDMILLATSWSAIKQILELFEKNCIIYSILCNTKKTVYVQLHGFQLEMCF